jgi:hypothetical protein
MRAQCKDLLVRQRELSHADAETRLRLPLSRLSARRSREYEKAARLVKALPFTVALGGLIAIMPACAAEISIIGDWEIVAAAPGPWTTEAERPALTNASKHLLNVAISFKPKEVVSKQKMFTCKRVVYEDNSLEHDALFQGNLPEPNPAAAAARLGFQKGDVTGVDVNCVNAKYVFHFLDRGTAMTTINNVIYTLKRR